MNLKFYVDKTVENKDMDLIKILMKTKVKPKISGKVKIIIFRVLQSIRSLLNFKFFVVICSFIFMFHPGRFSVLKFKTVSESEFKMSVHHFTGRSANQLVEMNFHHENVLNSINLRNFSLSDEPPRISNVRCYPGGSCSPLASSTELPLIALIVPYRNRLSHLRTFLPYMHTFLQMQGLNYTIILVEQEIGKPFNRAKLFNIGFQETLTHFPSTKCFIFHDVDLLPINPDNPYLCFSKPRHM